MPTISCITTHPLNLPHYPRHPLRQSVESLYELVRANVRKVDGNGSPLKNAVFGIYSDPECKVGFLTDLTTGADGGELKNKKI